MSDVGWASWLWRRIFGPSEGPLGGAGAGRTILSTLFIPSVDRDSKPINQTLWKRGALEWLGQAFGGATAYPPGLGVWRDDRREGQLVFDNTIVIICYTSEALLNANMANLKSFMVNMGRATSQGGVAYVVDQEFFEIPIE